MSTQIRGNKQIKNITIENSQIANGTIELDKLAEGSELLKRDGSVVATGDFDLGSNSIKNLAAPVDPNDAVRKADLDSATGGVLVNREIPSGSINGTNDEFTLASTPNIGTEQVFLNGALLNAGANSDYVLSDDTITFTIPPQSGDVILVNYITDGVVVNVDVDTTLNQFNSRLTTAESELFTAQGDITNLQNDVTALDGRVDSAEADVTALDGRVDAVEADVAALDTRVDTAESDIVALEAADDALDTRVTSLESGATTLGNRVTAVEGDITSLENADSAMDIRVGNIEDGLQAETLARTNADNALDARIDDLETATVALNDLTDVTITTPANNQVLKYNGSAWVNAEAPSSFSGSYNDLTDTPNIALAAVQWTSNHTLVDGTRYLVNDLVYNNGNVYRANYDNESIPTSSALYWTNLGAGSRLNIDGRDIPNIQYAQLSGKPSLADVATSGDYNDLTNKPSLFSGSYNDLTNKPTIYTPVKEVPTGSVNGSNVTFTMSDAPAVAGTEQVFLNGLLQFAGAEYDYTISGDTITFNTAPETGWKLVVFYFV